MNALRIATVPMAPASLPGHRRQPSAMITQPASGNSRISQAMLTLSSACAPTHDSPGRIGRPASSLNLPQLVDVDRQAAAVERDDQAESDRDLARRHDHYDQ